VSDGHLGDARGAEPRCFPGRRKLLAPTMLRIPRAASQLASLISMRGERLAINANAYSGHVDCKFEASCGRLVLSSTLEI